MKEIVVSGGIAGLAAAWRLCEGGAEVMIIERAAELSGSAENIDGQDHAPRA